VTGLKKELDSYKVYKEEKHNIEMKLVESYDKINGLNSELK